MHALHIADSRHTDRCMYVGVGGVTGDAGSACRSGGFHRVSYVLSNALPLLTVMSYV